MSFEVIPNQPISFERVGLVDPCACPCDIVPAKINSTDKSVFQIKIGPCDDEENLVSNPTFDVDLAGWTSTGTGLFIRGQLSGNGFLIMETKGIEPTVVQAGVFAVGNYYEVTFDVGFFSGAGETDIDLDIEGFSKTYNLPVKAANDSSPRDTYTFTGFATQTDLEFQVNGNLVAGGSSISIDNVIAKEIDLSYKVTICDVEGTDLHTINVADIISPSQLFSPEVRLVDGCLTFCIDWSSYSLESGCYRLCLYDPCLGTTTTTTTGLAATSQGELNPHSDWVETDPSNSHWDASGFAYLSIASEIQSITNTASTLAVGTDYEITITLGAVVSPLVQLNINPDGQIVDNNILTPQTFTIAGDGQSLNLLITNLDPGFEAVYLVDVDFFEAVPVIEPVDPVDPVLPDYWSNRFELTPDPCGVDIVVCNDSDGFGFCWEGLTLQTKLPAILRNVNYNIDREVFRTDRGRNIQTYYERRKTIDLVIDDQPASIIDFMSMAVGSDHMYVNGVEYTFSEGEDFTPISNQTSVCLYRLTLRLEEKVQDFKRIKCAPEGAGCPPEEECCDTTYCLVDPQTGITVLNLE